MSEHTEVLVGLILLPGLPLLGRGILMLRYRSRMRQAMTNEERDVVEHRGHLQVQAGFAFSAVLALALVQGPLAFEGALPIYYLGLSFTALWFAARGQSYKYLRWHDQALTAVAEIGSLAFFLGLLAVLHRSAVPSTAVWAITGLTCTAWLADHLIRLWIRRGILRSPSPAEGDIHAGEAQGNEAEPAEAGKA